MAKNKITFVPFQVGSPLPKEREDVIVRLEPIPAEGLPACYVWGYLRYSGSEKDKPFFVRIGAGYGVNRKVTHWARFLRGGFIEEVQRLERS